MKKLNLLITALVAAAALSLSGCNGDGAASLTPPPVNDEGGGTVIPPPPPTPPPPVDSTDTDGDGVVNTLDAFPNDPAAAVDSDGDGFPNAFNPNATDAQLDATTLVLDAFPNDPAATVDTDGDGKPDTFNPNATPEQIAASPLVVDDDDDNDGLLDVNDPAPLLGISDIPAGGTPTPTFGALPFEQQMIRFEEFGTDPMPTAAAVNWTPLPQPQNAQSGPLGSELDAFLAQPGASPYPTLLANITDANPWNGAIVAAIGRPLVSVAGGVPGPADGRPSGED